MKGTRAALLFTHADGSVAKLQIMFFDPKDVLRVLSGLDVLNLGEGEPLLQLVIESAGHLQGIPKASVGDLLSGLIFFDPLDIRPEHRTCSHLGIRFLSGLDPSFVHLFLDVRCRLHPTIRVFDYHRHNMPMVEFDFDDAPEGDHRGMAMQLVEAFHVEPHAVVERPLLPQ